MKPAALSLGLRANWRQFTLLVIVNAFVGAMVGLERTVVPLIAQADFGLVSKSVVLSFLVSFGVVKALANLFAGRLSDRVGRKRILVAGWLVGLPIPFLIIFAPSWGWIVFVNVLLGINQGLCWSTTVIMNRSRRAETARAGDGVERVRRLRRGLTLGPGDRLPRGSLRPAPRAIPPRHRLCRVRPRALRRFRSGLPLKQVGLIAATYPGVWGMSQLFTGALSDRLGRKWMIAAGMWVQAIGILLFVAGSGFWAWLGGAVLLGLGTAMVYPTLLAAISDVAHPDWRASAVGVYRLWRDGGYAVGALTAGLLADLAGIPLAIAAIAGLTFFSGIIVATVMYETLPGSRARTP